MKPSQFFYGFTKGQQKGVLALFLLIILLQAIYFILSSIDLSSDYTKSKEEKQWLALQSEINELKSKRHHNDTIYPFNPNYISDYKGYVLGLSVNEIDRIQAYRNTGKYINSIHDFKNISGVHDTLLAKLSPYFKFSEPLKYKEKDEGLPQHIFQKKPSSKPLNKIDINQALEEDLVKVYGIGPYFAKMILHRRSELGAFISMNQIDDFNQVSAEARKSLKNQFVIGNHPDILKININSASLLQLSRFPYFNKEIARSIITERSMNGKLSKISDLIKISGFPVDKEKIIDLYLEF